MKKYTPAKKAMFFFAILFFILLAAVGAGAYYVAKRFSLQMLMMIVFAIFALAIIIAVFAYLPLYFKHTAFYVGENSIKRNSGAFMLTSQMMKIKSVQYVSRVKLPFSKLTALNFIIVSALGGKIVLGFLSDEDSSEIEDSIRRYISSSETNFSGE